MKRIDSERLTLADALAAAHETKRLEFGGDILDTVPTVFRELFGERPAVVVTDENLVSVAGRKVHEVLVEAGIKTVPPFIFSDKDLYAEYRFVERLEEALRLHEAIPIAVGSGTINDLTKLAAHKVGRSYMSVATAASMDGYTAFGASITFNGLKQTFTCPAPVAVVADIEIIRQAPGKMNAWGYADLLAKVTAGADWLTADAFAVEPVNSGVWPIVQGRLRELVADPKGVRKGEAQSIHHLIEGLLLGGFAMQAARSSRPASGAEHQFSHLWDMQHHTHEGSTPSHGFKVGIGTLAVTALYEALFNLPLETVDVEHCCEQWPSTDLWRQKVETWHGTGEMADGAWQEMEAKKCTEEELREQLFAFRDQWPDLATKLRAQLIPFDELKQMLQAAGAPSEPEEIGIDRQRLRQSYWQAFSIRRRFTVLDFAVRLGVLDDCLDRIFGPGGVWPIDSVLKEADKLPANPATLQ